LYEWERVYNHNRFCPSLRSSAFQSGGDMVNAAALPAGAREGSERAITPFPLPRERV
jgi:hypothetical protein